MSSGSNGERDQVLVLCDEIRDKLRAEGLPTRSAEEVFASHPRLVLTYKAGLKALENFVESGEREVDAATDLGELLGLDWGKPEVCLAIIERLCVHKLSLEESFQRIKERLREDLAHLRSRKTVLQEDVDMMTELLQMLRGEATGSQEAPRAGDVKPVLLGPVPEPIEELVVEENDPGHEAPPGAPEAQSTDPEVPQGREEHREQEPTRPEAASTRDTSSVAADPEPPRQEETPAAEPTPRAPQLGVPRQRAQTPERHMESARPRPTLSQRPPTPPYPEAPPARKEPAQARPCAPPVPLPPGPPPQRRGATEEHSDQEFGGSVEEESTRQNGPDDGSDADAESSPCYHGEDESPGSAACAAAPPEDGDPTIADYGWASSYDGSDMSETPRRRARVPRPPREPRWVKLSTLKQSELYQRLEAKVFSRSSSYLQRFQSEPSIPRKIDLRGQILSFTPKRDPTAPKQLRPPHTWNHWERMTQCLVPKQWPLTPDPALTAHLQAVRAAQAKAMGVSFPPPPPALEGQLRPLRPPPPPKPFDAGRFRCWRPPPLLDPSQLPYYPVMGGPCPGPLPASSPQLPPTSAEAEGEARSVSAPLAIPAAPGVTKVFGPGDERAGSPINSEDEAHHHWSSLASRHSSLRQLFSAMEREASEAPEQSSSEEAPSEGEEGETPQEEGQRWPAQTWQQGGEASEEELCAGTTQEDTREAHSWWEGRDQDEQWSASNGASWQDHEYTRGSHNWQVQHNQGQKWYTPQQSWHLQQSWHQPQEQQHWQQRDRQGKGWQQQGWNGQDQGGYYGGQGHQASKGSQGKRKGRPVGSGPVPFRANSSGSVPSRTGSSSSQRPALMIYGARSWELAQVARQTDTQSRTEQPHAPQSPPEEPATHQQKEVANAQPTSTSGTMSQQHLGEDHADVDQQHGGCNNRQEGPLEDDTPNPPSAEGGLEPSADDAPSPTATVPGEHQ